MAGKEGKKQRKSEASRISAAPPVAPTELVVANDEVTAKMKELVLRCEISMAFQGFCNESLTPLLVTSSIRSTAICLSSVTIKLPSSSEHCLPSINVL
jgi:hypothetical protein